jgi:hypothetical protein
MSNSALITIAANNHALVKIFSLSADICCQRRIEQGPSSQYLNISSPRHGVCIKIKCRGICLRPGQAAAASLISRSFRSIVAAACLNLSHSFRALAWSPSFCGSLSRRPRMIKDRGRSTLPLFFNSILSVPNVRVSTFSTAGAQPADSHQLFRVVHHGKLGEASRLRPFFESPGSDNFQLT